ncbi:interferon regulatory factor 7 isoform X2 [Corythoichthys intestinalis]|uniref:interferon regulatory factor 7 isoform X2 n=1 Tax=Corythoichthys intestinalis TaxID=161448 RepID=UPI0025A5B52A|nr:interferon regulatory factor 7 isoform X2 [Corythoichthys intestinalis]
MQCPQKPMFANWLIEQVEAGQYEGLCYVAQNKIRIPWKHISKKDCSVVDTKIFHAWAVVSGKISDFPKDKARWKTNFRCNLNHHPRFKLVEDNSKTTDPHKIYEIINTKSNDEFTQNIQAPTEDSDMIVDLYRAPTEKQYANDFMVLEPGIQPSGMSQFDRRKTITFIPFVMSLIKMSFPSLYPSLSHWCAIEYFQNYLTVQGTHSVAAIAKNASHLLEVNPYLPQYRSIDLEVSIHYRNRLMLKTIVNTARLQLHYPQQATENNFYSLCFPTTEGLLDHKQIEYTNRILNSIQRGLLLEVHESGIYGIRQDTCRVFASTDIPSMAPARKLPKNTIVELFNVQKFIQELKQFKENSGGTPNYKITMCFGEMFPDGKPLEKKLIVVQVVPLIFQSFHEKAQSEGASSLNSANVSLQLSNSFYDFIASQLSPPTTEFNEQSN